MTANNLRNLLAALPARILRTIKKLSKETGLSVETIVEQGVELFKKRAASKLMRGDDVLAKLMNDPIKRAIFDEITMAMGKRSSAGFTAEQKTARGVTGGTNRAKALSKEERSSIAKAAALTRWQRRDEQRKAAEIGSSKPL